MSKEEFEKTLRLGKFALLLSGIKLHSDQRWHILEYFIDQCLFNLNVVTLYAVIFGELYWVVDGIQTGKSFVELSLTSPCITISVLGTIKSLLLYLNRDLAGNVVDKLRLMHPEFEEGESEEINGNNGGKEIIEETMKFLKLVIFVLMSINCAVMVMFCGAPLLSMIYDYFSKAVWTIKYPFMVKYSFDAYESSWWGLIYFHQVWATVIVCLNLFGADTLFFAICSYMEMHLRLLGIRFENIVAKSLYETRDRLGRAVRRHQELIDLVDKTEVLYSKSMLCHIVTSSLLICLSAFNITVAGDFRTIFAFITFLMMSLSQISLLCFFGDMLMRSSMELSGCIYKSKWYNVDQDTMKTILIVLIRTQKPCRLTAAKFADLNLRAFTTILSRSWSYFALLKTVYN